MQHQCLSNELDGGFTKGVGLQVDSSCHFPSLSLSLSNFFCLSLCFILLLTLLSHCTTILPTASRVSVKLKLFELCFCTTALSLWQREGNEERLSSASQHCYRTIKSTFRSLRWVISSKGKKRVPHWIPGSIMLISPLLCYFFGNSTPLKVIWFLPWKQNKTNPSLSFLMNIFFSKFGVLLDFFSFLICPTITQ